MKEGKNWLDTELFYQKNYAQHKFRETIGTAPEYYEENKPTTEEEIKELEADALNGLFQMVWELNERLVPIEGFVGLLNDGELVARYSGKVSEIVSLKQENEALKLRLEQLEKK